MVDIVEKNAVLLQKKKKKHLGLTCRLKFNRSLIILFLENQAIEKIYKSIGVTGLPRQRIYFLEGRANYMRFFGNRREKKKTIFGERILKFF